MRTGTKIALGVAVWTCCMATFLIVVLPLVSPRLFQYVPATLGALLGANGLNFGVNEIRKAIENRGGPKNVSG